MENNDGRPDSFVGKIKNAGTLVTLLIVIIGLGISWGVVTQEIAALRADLIDFKQDQNNWNHDERATDESHRLRLQHLEDRLFDFVTKQLH